MKLTLLDLSDAAGLIFIWILMLLLIVVLFRMSISFLFDPESTEHDAFMRGCMARYNIVDDNYNKMKSYCEREYRVRHGLQE